MVEFRMGASRISLQIQGLFSSCAAPGEAIGQDRALRLSRRAPRR